MPEDVHSFLHRLSSYEKVSDIFNSHLMHDAFELIDASLWLIAGQRYHLALNSLHSAIELAFKADLERIHPVLISDLKKTDYDTLKKIFKGNFNSHPKGKHLNISDFDFEKTITFSEALSRIRDIYPSVLQWEKKLKRIQHFRNSYTHHGKKETSTHECIKTICLIAFPFIEIFIEESCNLTLESLTGKPIYNELKVAMKYCKEHNSKSKNDLKNALSTVASSVLYRDTHSNLVNKDGWHIDNFDIGYEASQHFKGELNTKWEGYIVESHCKICGSSFCFLEIDQSSLPGIESAPTIDDIKFIDASPNAISCMKCNLEITSADSILAKLHYGKVPAVDIKNSIERHLGYL